MTADNFAFLLLFASGIGCLVTRKLENHKKLTTFLFFLFSVAVGMLVMGFWIAIQLAKM